MKRKGMTLMNVKEQFIVNQILDLIKKPNYQSLTIEEFFCTLKLENLEDNECLKKALDYLVEESELFLNKKKTRYVTKESLNYYKGVISIKNPNYGFIETDEFHYDLYVSKNKFNGAFDKDVVLFKVNKEYKAKSNSHDEAEVIKVLKRSIETLVGKVYQKKNDYYLENDNYLCKINNLNGAKIDNIVNLKITSFSPYMLEGDVISVIGSAKDIGIDILMEAARHGFNTKFNDSTLYEAKLLEYDLESEKKKRRLSLDKEIYTIDGDDSKDLDDAVSVARINNHYFLGVYIADVSFFVKEGSFLDKEAYSRSTSLYLADTVIPMLPVRLSNDLCSLNQREEKLAIACEMEIDEKGNVLTSDIFETVIKTKKRLTYSKCNELLETGKVDSDKEYDDKLYETLKLMAEVANVLKEKEKRRGSLDFDVPEGKIVIGEDGEVVDVVRIERGESERIIESFMICANEAIASTIEAMDLPFIYRVHDKPDIIKLQDLRVVAGYMGYSLRGTYASEVQKFLDSIHPEDEFLKTLALRMMPKAVYSLDNIGHFGLASEAYTHFTSPIRRYPDLLVHRLLRKYIFLSDINEKEFSSLENKITEISEHTSRKERDSISCEYDVEDMKKAEYMSKFIGDVFIGKITSITNFGMFVTLDNTVEGMIRIKDMKDDYYIFDSNLYLLRGERTNRKFRIGDEIKVKLVRADKEKREIDFEIVYNNSKSGKKYGKESYRKK